MKLKIILLSLFIFCGLAQAKVNITFTPANGTNWQRNSIVSVGVVLTNASANAVNIQGVELNYDYESAGFKAVPTMKTDNYTGGLVVDEIDLSVPGKVHYVKAKQSGTYRTLAGNSSLTVFTLEFKVTSASAQEGSTLFDFSGYFTNDVSDTDANSLAGTFTNNSYIIIADTTAPIINAAPGSMTMNASTVTPITLSLDGSYTGDDLQYIKYTLDGSDPVDGSDSYSSPITIPANVGQVTLKFRGRDNDGNWQAIQTRTYTVDTTDPEMSNLAVTPALARMGDTVTVSFTVGEQLGSNPTVLVDGKPTTLVSSTYPNYVYTRVIDGSETQGTAIIYIQIADKAGNTATDTSMSLTIDYAVPVYTPLVIGPRPVASGNPVTVTFNASERLSTVTTVNIMGHLATRITEIDNGNGTWKYVYRSANLTGTETTALVVVHGYDMAGNRSNNTDNWGNITVTGTDLTNNTGYGYGQLDFIIEGQ